MCQARAQPPTLAQSICSFKGSHTAGKGPQTLGYMTKNMSLGTEGRKEGFPMYSYNMYHRQLGYFDTFKVYPAQNNVHE